MFVEFNKDEQRVPIKIWLDKKEDLEAGALRQAINLANLPFVYKHVALCPDVHCGFGMPIGGVIATEGVIIPDGVGKDIGCGMSYCLTNIPAEIFRKDDDISDK